MSDADVQRWAIQLAQPAKNTDHSEGIVCHRPIGQCDEAEDWWSRMAERILTSGRNTSEDPSDRNQQRRQFAEVSGERQRLDAEGPLRRRSNSIRNRAESRTASRDRASHARPNQRHVEAVRRSRASLPGSFKHQPRRRVPAKRPWLLIPSAGSSGRGTKVPDASHRSRARSGYRQGEPRRSLCLRRRQKWSPCVAAAGRKRAAGSRNVGRDHVETRSVDHEWCCRGACQWSGQIHHH